MNNKMITIPYADAIEYGENTSALFKALWELTDLIRLESDLDVYKRQTSRWRNCSTRRTRPTPVSRTG